MALLAAVRGGRTSGRAAPGAPAGCAFLHWFSSVLHACGQMFMVVHQEPISADRAALLEG